MVGMTDINRARVGTGFAVVFRRYSSDYVSAEENAKVNKRGIWSAAFQMPSYFRHSADVPVPVRKSTSKRKGQWIYHLPGMPYYNQTRPEEIFCSEAEAQAAGYRRAIVR